MKASPDFVFYFGENERLTPDQQREIGRKMHAARERAEAVGTDKKRKKEREAALKEYRSHRDRLVMILLPMVIEKAGRWFRTRPHLMEDGVMSCVLELVNSIDKYDPEKFAVTTFANGYMKKGFNDFFANLGHEIRIPTHAHQIIRNVKRSSEYLATASESSKLAYRNAMRVADSFSASGGGVVEDYGFVSREEDPSAGAEESERLALVKKCLDALDDRERYVVTRRFGLDGEEPETLRSIGDREGVSREWIRQIHERAIKKLAKKFGGVDMMEAV